MEIQNEQKETNTSIQNESRDNNNLKENKSKLSQNQKTNVNETANNDLKKEKNNKISINESSKLLFDIIGSPKTADISNDKKETNILQIDSSSPFYFSDKPEDNASDLVNSEKLTTKGELKFTIETSSISITEDESKKSQIKEHKKENVKSNLDQYFDVTDKKQLKKLRKIKRKMKNVRFMPNVILIDCPPNEEEIYRFHQKKHHKEMINDENKMKQWLSSPRKIRTHDRTVEANEELLQSPKAGKIQALFNDEEDVNENDISMSDIEGEESIKCLEEQLLQTYAKEETDNNEEILISKTAKAIQEDNRNSIAANEQSSTDKDILNKETTDDLVNQNEKSIDNPIEGNAAEIDQSLDLHDSNSETPNQDTNLTDEISPRHPDLVANETTDKENQANSSPTNENEDNNILNNEDQHADESKSEVRNENEANGVHSNENDDSAQTKNDNEDINSIENWKDEPRSNSIDKEDMQGNDSEKKDDMHNDNEQESIQSKENETESTPSNETEKEAIQINSTEKEDTPQIEAEKDHRSPNENELNKETKSDNSKKNANSDEKDHPTQTNEDIHSPNSINQSLTNEFNNQPPITKQQETISRQIKENSKLGPDEGHTSEGNDQISFPEEPILSKTYSPRNTYLSNHSSDLSQSKTDDDINENDANNDENKENNINDVAEPIQSPTHQKRKVRRSKRKNVPTNDAHIQCSIDTTNSRDQEQPIKEPDWNSNQHRSSPRIRKRTTQYQEEKNNQTDSQEDQNIQFYNDENNSNNSQNKNCSGNSDSSKKSKNNTNEAEEDPYLQELKNRAKRFESLDDVSDEDLKMLLDSISEDISNQKSSLKNLHENLILKNVKEYVENIIQHRKQKERMNKQFNRTTPPKPKTLNQSEIDAILHYNDENWVRERLQEFDKETKKKVREILEQHKKSENEMLQQHEKEEDELEAVWNSNSKRRMYNHPSPRLNELMRQKKILSYHNRMIEAENVQKEIAELKQRETSEAVKNMQHDFDEAASNLKKRQNRDLAFLKEANQVKLERYKQMRAQERKGLEFRASKLKHQKELEAKENKTREVKQTDESSIKVTKKPTTLRALLDMETELLSLPPLVIKRKKSSTSNQAENSEATKT